MEGLTRNVGSFARFLETISFSQAAVLNLSEVSREAGVARKTVEEYVSVLEDLLLAQRIPVFARRARRKMTSHPRFFLFDAGVYRALRPHGPLDAPEEIEGAARSSPDCGSGRKYALPFSAPHHEIRACLRHVRYYIPVRDVGF